MRCRLLLPMCAVSVCLSICLSRGWIRRLLQCMRGHSVQPLPNYYGLLFQYRLLLVQLNTQSSTEYKYSLYKVVLCKSVYIVILVRAANTDPKATWEGEVSADWTVLLSQLQGNGKCLMSQCGQQYYYTLTVDAAFLLWYSFYKVRPNRTHLTACLPYIKR